MLSTDGVVELHCLQLLRALRDQVREQVRKQCAGLQGIVLSNNAISDKGAEVLADAIERDQRLMVVNLNDNQLTQVGRGCADVGGWVGGCRWLRDSTQHVEQIVPSCLTS